MNREIKTFRIKADELSVSQDAMAVKEISGYASVFNVKDSHNDIVLKGAFSKTITSPRKLKLLSSHNISDAREILGTITELKEDEHGLYFKANISSAPSAQDIAIKAKEGHLDEISIGYYPKAINRRKDGINELTEIELLEISLVTRASNAEAQVLSVKQEDSNVCKQKEIIMSEQEKKEEIVEVKAETVSKEQFEALQTKLANLEKELDKPQRKSVIEVPQKKEEVEVKEDINLKQMHAFQDLVLKKINRYEYSEVIGHNTKALQSNIEANGGVLVPESIMNRIKDERARINRIGNMVERIQINGPFKIPDFDFSETLNKVAENDNIDIDDISDAFGKSELNPQTFGVIVKLSETLMRRNQVEPLEGFLGKRYARKFLDQLEDHIFTGTGHNQPLGIVPFIDATESAGGKTVTTTASATLANLDYDDLVDLEHLLDEEYRQNAVIFVSPICMARIKKLKDSQNMPIWNRSVAAGQPNTLLGYPVFESKSLDNSSLGSAGKTVAIICDPKEYLLGEELGFGVKVIDGGLTLARSDQIALKMMASYDGLPLDKNAFGRIETA